MLRMASLSRSNLAPHYGPLYKGRGRSGSRAMASLVAKARPPLATAFLFLLGDKSSIPHDDTTDRNAGLKD